MALKSRVALSSSRPADFEAGASSDTWRNGLRDFGQDQRQMWTSPARIRLADAAWLLPLGGIAAGLFASDRQYSASLAKKSSSMTPTLTMTRYTAASNAGIAALAGAGAGLYLMSFPTHNEHWRETGFLAGEAALNSLIPVELVKYSLARQRPDQADGSGAFFHGGTSFPSEHSAVAWSIAGVVAHEYSGVLPQLMAYGTAAAIDFSRVRGRQHFPSDVLIGSALGYLSAQNIYRRRHDPEPPGLDRDGEPGGARVPRVLSPREPPRGAGAARAARALADALHPPRLRVPVRHAREGQAHARRHRRDGHRLQRAQRVGQRPVDLRAR